MFGRPGRDPDLDARFSAARHNTRTQYPSEWVLLLDTSNSMQPSFQPLASGSNLVRNAGLDILCVAAQHDANAKMQQVYFASGAVSQGEIALANYHGWLRRTPPLGSATHFGEGLRLAVELGAQELNNPALTRLVDPTNSGASHGLPFRIRRAQRRVPPGSNLILPRPVVGAVITDGDYHDSPEVERVLSATRNTGFCVITAYVSDNPNGLQQMRSLAHRYPNFKLLEYRGGLKTLSPQTFTAQIADALEDWVQNVARGSQNAPRLIAN